MRLLTHNLLQCNRKQCSGGYPLKIRLADVPECTTWIDSNKFNPEFIRNLLKKLSWDALRETATSLSLPLPLSYTEDDLNDNNFLSLVNNTVMNFHILEGDLICPICNRVFPVSQGIWSYETCLSG